MFRVAHRTQKNVTYIYQFIIESIIKDTEQLDKEIHRVRSGRVPSTGASVSMEVGCFTLSASECVSQP